MADKKIDQKLCGMFGREDVVCHVHTQMINWHGHTGTIFSIDIQPLKDGQKRRVATGGSDSNVQLWELKGDNEGVGCVEHMAELSRHDCAVNVVKFHPTEDILASASDDRCLFIWRHDNSNMDDAPRIFSDDQKDGVENKENWTVIKQIRGHGSEVYDLSWSPNAKYILSGTMDNTAYVWNASSCKKVATLQQHKSYVQGVAWDPFDKFITTVSSDRSAIVYNTGKFEVVQRITKIKSKSSKQTVSDVPETPTPASAKSTKDLKIFLDTGMVDTFFRRPGISPDGKLVAYPCGCYEVEDSEKSDVREGEDTMVQINVVYVFQHNNFENPVLCLPTGNSPAIAVRFCPQLFALRPKNDTHQRLFDLPYRMVYAVITLDNIILYDTQQQAPFACISSIHYEQLTDASWSSDGQYLIVSSIDGFCTIVTIDLERLGQPYRPPLESDVNPNQHAENADDLLPSVSTLADTIEATSEVVSDSKPGAGDQKISTLETGSAEKDSPESCVATPVEMETDTC